jgi:hypothetical protein
MRITTELLRKVFLMSALADNQRTEKKRFMKKDLPDCE